MNMTYADFNILDQYVLVQYSSAELQHTLAPPLRAFSFSPPASADPDLILAVTAADTVDTADLYTVTCEGRPVGQTTSLAHCFRLLEWQLDLFLSTVITDRLLLHAGAVAQNGVSIIFPGISGSGKSSLTLALLLADYVYLSDELAVIDTTNSHITAFPKPLSIKNRAPFATEIPDKWFGPDAAEIATARQQRPDYQPVWYIHPDDLAARVCQDSLPVRFIIFPTYIPDHAPQLVPLSTNDTLQMLIENSVNFPQFTGKGLHLLSQLVANTVGYRLKFNDLTASVQLMNQLMMTVD